MSVVPSPLRLVTSQYNARADNYCAGGALAGWAVYKVPMSQIDPCAEPLSALCTLLTRTSQLYIRLRRPPLHTYLCDRTLRRSPLVSP
ncbi:hypothetical protein CERSUDRAFT_112885 [Gelatoporia subvermispora B]|uniref:Uncharacterized protein n=1 Tax=Ceriporiopsis subvermispora (strain B) TaxID=914234 RepID=M2R3U3_CERS8|nr:hypothetical protein CERSUDRAFT_112885 [Gelatoporia subvermispora B]